MLTMKFCDLQGYGITSAEIDMSLEEFKEKFAANGQVDKKEMHFSAEENQEPTEDNPTGEGGQRIYVFYSDEPNVGVKTMRQFIGALDQQDIKRGIIIWSEKMTPAAKKVIEAMRGQFILEDFDEASLLVNITQHTLVPKHEVMTPEEKKELLQRYRLKDNQLPRIQPTDPVARYFGLTRGQVVRITRRESSLYLLSVVKLFSDNIYALRFAQLPRPVDDTAVIAFATELINICCSSSSSALARPTSGHLVTSAQHVFVTINHTATQKHQTGFPQNACSDCYE
jgi:DNA-directed RNA polymerases I, II, and III subunit RPABC1